MLTDLFLGVGGRSIDGHIDRTSRRIGRLAVVDGPSGKAVTAHSPPSKICFDR